METGSCDNRTEPPWADIGQTDLVKDLIKSNQEHVRRYEELKHSIPSIPAVNRQDTLPIDNGHEELLGSTTMTSSSSEKETELNNLHHFTLLFQTLMNETSSASYHIGPQSRVRIEKHILNARASEVMWLYKIYGEAIVRDVCRKLGPGLATTFDSTGHEPRPPQTLNTSSISLTSSKIPKRIGRESPTTRQSDHIHSTRQSLAQGSGVKSSSRLTPRGSTTTWQSYPDSETLAQTSGDTISSWLITSDEEHDLETPQPSSSRQKAVFEPQFIRPATISGRLRRKSKTGCLSKH